MVALTDKRELLQGKAQYDRDGYAIFKNVLDEDLIPEAKNHVQWLMQKHPELRPEHLGHTLVNQDPFWVRLISDHRLLDVAELFIGPNIALFADDLAPSASAEVVPDPGLPVQGVTSLTLRRHQPRGPVRAGR